MLLIFGQRKSHHYLSLSANYLRELHLRLESAEFNFGEYHPRVFPELYNQTISTANWRLTLYPARPEWGELFDLSKDPGEHFNVFNESESNQIIAQLSEELASRFPPKPDIDNEALCKW